MNRRTFFANLLGGSVAALWPYPPKPIICEAKLPPLFDVDAFEDHFGYIRNFGQITNVTVTHGMEEPQCEVQFKTFDRGCGRSMVPLREVLALAPVEMWPDGETLAYRK